MDTIEQAPASTPARQAVTMYGRPGCGPCRATERGLESAGVVYAYADGAAHRDELAALGHTQSPVVVVRDGRGAVTDHWHGFRPDLIAALAA
ncbi:glutaredoxin family protein [Sinomonas halotolerans]|uniref:Glutaredoxin family protein n=1 Tax=Sinomonas halotolerans TaxID=1644133 RepID=A0ABU9WZU6_9MICC